MGIRPKRKTVEKYQDRKNRGQKNKRVRRGGKRRKEKKKKMGEDVSRQCATGFPSPDPPRFALLPVGGPVKKTAESSVIPTSPTMSYERAKTPREKRGKERRTVPAKGKKKTEETPRESLPRNRKRAESCMAFVTDVTGDQRANADKHTEEKDAAQASEVKHLGTSDEETRNRGQQVITP
ncbi:hypothetical protein VTK73DRAFT_4662 [Phialemonium thermophilum]|uniref:Uncharacterized protein n=1 Tax=Phialemonium thermophilum TaxID=223376 RepID=A0ABR3V705_9PEZI